jgi:hypothetical protein
MTSAVPHATAEFDEPRSFTSQAVKYSEPMFIDQIVFAKSYSAQLYRATHDARVVIAGAAAPRESNGPTDEEEGAVCVMGGFSLPQDPGRRINPEGLSHEFRAAVALAPPPDSVPVFCDPFHFL